VAAGGWRGRRWAWAILHPGGQREGLGKAVALIRDLFGSFGTPADIPMIRDFPERVVDERVALVEPSVLRSIRDDVRQGVQEAIDMIRAREAAGLTR
jgi:hypothetical protein